jgi:hypothetical protein
MSADPSYVSVPLPVCGCGAAVMVVAPGSDGEASELLGVTLATRRGVPDRGWCEACAIAAGWPWLASERRARRAA